MFSQNSLNQAFTRLSQRVGRTDLELRLRSETNLSVASATPFAVHVFIPTISRLSTESIEVVLAHEIGHALCDPVRYRQGGYRSAFNARFCPERNETDEAWQIELVADAAAVLLLSRERVSAALAETRFALGDYPTDAQRPSLELREQLLGREKAMITAGVRLTNRGMDSLVHLLRQTPVARRADCFSKIAKKEPLFATAVRRRVCEEQCPRTASSGGPLLRLFSGVCL